MIGTNLILSQTKNNTKEHVAALKFPHATQSTIFSVIYPYSATEIPNPRPLKTRTNVNSQRIFGAISVTSVRYQDDSLSLCDQTFSPTLPSGSTHCTPNWTVGCNLTSCTEALRSSPELRINSASGVLLGPFYSSESRAVFAVNSKHKPKFVANFVDFGVVSCLGPDISLVFAEYFSFF